jgi:hypothetical protein
LELNAWISMCSVADNPHEAVEGLAGFASVSTDDVLASPIVLVGSESEIVERLHERRARWGYSSFCVTGPQLNCLLRNDGLQQARTCRGR